MSFVKLADTTGFDASRDLLVLPLRQQTNLYLPNFGAPLRIRSADPKIASIAASQDLAAQSAALKNLAKNDPVATWFGVTKIVMKGETLGTTQLLAEQMDGTQYQNPTKVVVVSNLDGRQVDRNSVSLQLQQELQSMSLRQAAVRVAEDQLYSAVAGNTHGDGRYDLPTNIDSTDWCGAFVYWCYKRACAIKGARNPLGPVNDVVLSPQKAITWAIHNPLAAGLLRYQGPVLIHFNNKQLDSMKQATFVDAKPGENLLAGDICLLRDETNWRHVDMIYDPGDGDTFTTIDGNQGLPSIKIVQRNFTERLGGTIFAGQYKHVFVHLNIPA